ncbi:precorrin-3B C(17)-methyltransferase [Paenibacillus radicis (ex Xue et al. 2023)]|uniref:Precorrin-3B C(17)-methyltransferase n=1 Tax=Paenibacillus radicis (ex Xue et al. 2023) TaxID=2972489 RepID=A0ABT1YDU4_9BACL|nr:precorrin-3B C(17)-methyltransferase [Paenibacillus radicis (ex Xue et al. 2023)]MCR8631366.1 precorrin-3B C(17)-methyltransferase [Paenibacillus radicis (ex Xue et al. 2023)]
MAGKLLIIGFGPGSFEHITKRAREALQESEVIIGYNTYVDLIRGLLTDQAIVRTGMTEEVSRAQEAVRQAEAGKKVAVISSGDAGVYGMAGLVYEVLMEQGWRREGGVEVEIIPGISAINSSASLLGAPVMHDACTISLSDHLTPWELIAKRVDAAGQADFVIALYNPRSGRRTRQIVETQRILLKYRSPETPVGIVKSAYREREHVVVTNLRDMLDHDIGMLTTVIIGNSSTTVYDGLMITPRGYQRKYTLGADVQPLRPHQRLQQEAEPWALKQWDSEPVDDGDEDWAFEEDDDADEAEAVVKAPERGSGTVAAAAAGREVTPGGGGGTLAVSAEPEAAPGRGSGAVAVAAAEREATLGSAGGTLAVGAEREAVPGRGSGSAAATPLLLALEALQLAARGKGEAVDSSVEAAAGGAAALAGLFRQQSIFELAVSPGVADKKFTAKQMITLADVVGEKGSMEYTPHHQMILRIPTENPEEITARLRGEGFLLAPIGDVAQIKACDFCNGEKGEAIPYAESLQQKLGGMKVPKELRIGLNGCGMACYGAVNEDIGIVYRKGKFDLFLGGKTVGRNVHPAQPVAEGIDPDRLVETIERIVHRFIKEGHPNERFHKFFKRAKELEGYRHQDMPAFTIENAICGD